MLPQMVKYLQALNNFVVFSMIFYMIICLKPIKTYLIIKEKQFLISIVLLCILQNFHFIRINNNFYGDINPKRPDVSRPTSF